MLGLILGAGPEPLIAGLEQDFAGRLNLKASGVSM